MTSIDTGLDVRREPGRTPLLRAEPMRDIEYAVGWLTDTLPAIRAELLRSGCLLIRGLPVAGTTDFATIRDVLLPRPAGYREKATPRSDYGHGVFSSTDLPAAQPIRLHNENSYTLEFPGLLLFGCLVAPDEGGATTVGDMRMALRLLPPALRERFTEMGWLLVRNYSEMAGLPWRTSFATDNRAAVEAYCRDNVVSYEWLEDGSLRTRQRRAAIITHPVTHEPLWFNHVAFWNKWTLDAEVREILLDTFGEDGLPFGTYYGDGTGLGEADAGVLNHSYDQVTMREAWQPGDLMLVDNLLCAHGRESFRGNRKIVVSMGDPVALDACSPTTAPATTAYGT
jgi:alpha-ketoglutarate-dependent taurine dioxygenase